MKTYIKQFIFVLAGFIVCSCTTSQEIIVTGAPGTEIYSPSKQKLAVIGNDGQAKIKISSNDYFAYLMTHKVNSNEFVPFALDYKNKSYIRTKQTQYKRRYKYLSFHKTNEDIRFLPIVDNGQKKRSENNGKQLQSTISETPVNEEGRSSTAKAKTSKSKRTLKDYGKLLSGTYVGNGALSQKEGIVEEYENIKVIIQRIDNNNVYVDVLENGESFFNSKAQYSIKKNEHGGYTLSLKGIPTAIINIDAQKNLVYYHPKVNIDGELYTLEITTTP